VVPFLALNSDRTNAISLAVLREMVSIDSRKASPGILPVSAFLSILRSVSMAASERPPGECSTEYEYGREHSLSYSGGETFISVSSTSVSVDGLTGIDNPPSAFTNPESSSAESNGSTSTGRVTVGEGVSWVVMGDIVACFRSVLPVDESNKTGEVPTCPLCDATEPNEISFRPVNLRHAARPNLGVPITSKLRNQHDGRLSPSVNITTVLSAI
jgi:hypothetical protein